MSEAPKRIALIEDDEDLRISTTQWLSLSGFEIDAFASAEPALSVIDASYPGIVITDVRLPRFSGIELFRALHERDADLPIILITGHGSVDMAVAALKAGAWDFITKPFDPEALVAAATRAQMARALALENRALRAQINHEDIDSLLGRSAAMQHLRKLVPLLAASDIDIFIEGETGTGKSTLAREIHRAGKQSRHRFLTLCCSALPEALEGEIFATHGSNSLTAAQRGTLLLDNLELARPGLQARLTTVLEERLLRPLRGEPIALDFRVIATADDCSGNTPATINPQLFYQIAGMRLRLPPLRERREDIPMLFAAFSSSASQRLDRPIPTITASVQEWLLTHHWPGNVRELLHFAERFVLGLEEAAATPSSPPLMVRVDYFERDAIIETFLACDGKADATMQRLGLPRKTFYYKVARHRIDLKLLRQQQCRTKA